MIDEAAVSSALALRSRELFAQHRDAILQRTDRMFAWLMFGQWLFAIAVASVVSPYTWAGRTSSIHLHIYAAVLLGGLLSSLPIALARLRPGFASTRYIIATSQMLWSALLIHLTGGRIETHFHVFGGLAILAFYRDWKVLIPATLVVVVDHLVRGVFWPQSVYGIASPESWRFLEHAFWVVFEVTFLIVVIVVSLREMHEIAQGRAEQEAVTHRIELAVVQRTAELSERTKELSQANQHLETSLKNLRNTQLELVQAGKLALVGQLAAGVGHEVNNPLSYIASNLDFVVSELGPDMSADVRESLNDARDGAERIREIVRELQIFSRTDEQELHSIDVNETLNRSIRMAATQLRHAARVVTDFGSVAPVIANGTRLGQLFLNLLINAAQAIGDGQVERNEIRVASRTDQNGQIVVEISDTGPGIPENVRARIFEPFFTTKPVGKGTGLGLSICHDIVVALGGTITIESEVGRGTLVRVTLPPGASLQTRGASIPGPPASARKRVLVIDDEAPVRRALRKALRSEHDVELVSCAPDALERILAGERYDLILCDLMMPEMTGIDLHEALRVRVPEVLPHIVFMTGGAFTDGAREFVERSMRTFVEKPVDAKRLLTMIENPK